MCETCPAHIMGPGEVAGKVARSKGARRVMFWGFAVPMLPFAVWGVFGWWTIALVALAAVLSAAGVAYMRVMSRHVLIQAPASVRPRTALPAPVPARAIIRKRRAVTTGQRAIEAPRVVLPGQVLTAAEGEKVAR